MKMAGCLIAAMLFCGCTSISRYYAPNPAAADLQLSDYEGPLTAISVGAKDVDGLMRQMLAEDYVLIGTADFTGNGDLNWCGAMVRLGEDLKAEKIFYASQYLGTEHSVGYMAMPTSYSSTATVWGHHGPRSVSVTTYGSQYVPYDNVYSMNAFSVMYFKKEFDPPPFGIVFRSPDDELARAIGTRSVVVVEMVIPGKVAWKNDLFAGDIILEVDGKKATVEAVREFCRHCHGKTLKLKRDTEIIEKTVL